MVMQAKVTRKNSLFLTVVLGPCMLVPMRSCEECMYAYLQDTGYSNYTVMGTDFYCLKKLHPNDGFDLFYGKEEKLFFATECAEFTAGLPVHVDVDQDDVPWNENCEPTNEQPWYHYYVEDQERRDLFAALDD
jgi:hypothetical protein